MYKKFFTLSVILAICVNIFNLGFMHQVDATTKTYSIDSLKNQSIWTVDELMYFSDIAEQELESYCETANDFRDCAMTYSEERELEHGIYRAVNTYDRATLILSSINPSEQTIKVIFKSEDKNFKYMTGLERKVKLSNLYLASFDVGYVTYDMSGDIVSHSAPEVHELFTGLESELGANWLPSDTENTLKVDNFVISPTIQNAIFYKATDSDNSSSLGKIDFSSCLNSPDYQIGDECRVVFNSDGGRSYVPVKTSSLKSEQEETAKNDDTEASSADSLTDIDAEASSENHSDHDGNISASVDTNYSSNQASTIAAKTNSTSSAVTPSVTHTSSDIVITSNSNNNRGEQSSVSGDTQNIDNTSAVDNESQSNSENLEVPKLQGSSRQDSLWFVLLLSISLGAMIIWWLLPIKPKNRE